MGSVDVEWYIRVLKDRYQKEIKKYKLILTFYNIGDGEERSNLLFKINFYEASTNYKAYFKQINKPNIRIEKSNIEGHCEFEIILENFMERHGIQLKNNNLILEFEIEDRNFKSEDDQGIYKDKLDFSFNMDDNGMTTLDSYDVRYEIPWETSRYLRGVIRWNDLFNQSKYFNAILTSDIIYNSKIVPLSIVNKKLILSFTAEKISELNHSNSLRQVFYIQHLKIKKLKAFFTFLAETSVGAIISFIITYFLT